MVSNPSKKIVAQETLTSEELSQIDAYWRACNYLAVGMIYLTRQPSVKRTFETRTHQTKITRTLGCFSCSEFYLYSPQSTN